MVHTVQEANHHSVAAHLPLLMSEYLATMVRENFLSLLLDDKVYFQRQEFQIRCLQHVQGEIQMYTLTQKQLV